MNRHHQRLTKIYGVLFMHRWHYDHMLCFIQWVLVKMKELKMTVYTLDHITRDSQVQSRQAKQRNSHLSIGQRHRGIT